MTIESKNIPQGKINETYRLYDESIWIIGVGLLFLTWKSIDEVLSSEYKLYNISGLLFVWLVVLLKVYKIHIEDSRTIIFRSLIQKIVLNPQDISDFQEWVRGARIVYKSGSIILWPYIEKQGQFKSTLHSINPNIVFTDISKEGTKTNVRVFLLLLVVFAYFGWLIWSLFHGITQSFK